MRHVALCQRRRAHASNHRRIVRARDGHCHHLSGAIHRRNREAVGVLLTRHKFIVRTVHGVGPYASRCHAECAVFVTPSYAALRHKRSRVVHISDGQRACCALRCIGFCQARCAHASNHRRIVRAVDGHCDHFGGAIHRRNREAVGVCNTSHKLVVGGIHHIRPHARSRDAEFAVLVSTRHVALRHKRGRIVHISNGQAACRRLGHIAFCQRRRGRATNHRRIVCARHGHCHHLGGAIHRRNRKAVGVLLTRHKLVMRTVHHVGPCARRVNTELAVSVVAAHASLRHK